MKMLNVIAGAAAALVLGGFTITHAAPVKIRVSYVVPVANWPPVLAEKRDLAKHWGKSYTFEAVRYQGTPPMITALANNELEIATLAYSTLGIAVQNAGLTDLRVIADEFQDGVPGYFSNQFLVRKDSGIKSLKDLKGKVLATNSIGSGIDIAMKAALKKEGLLDKRDYTVIEAPFPTMAALLKDKKADMVSAVMPFALSPVFKKEANVLYDQTKGLGRSQFVFWAARKGFIDKHRAALVDLMEDVIRIERWYLDPKNHDEVAKIASKLLKVPAARFGWLYTKKDYYRDPNAKPDLEALQKNVDTTADLGFIRKTINVKQHSDLSIVEEAAKRLK
ncbi:MAG: ABC transporter substrate-binding protein [Hyphomicrobiales bacterium]|nr:ABC transporter substrate-binding protein [Hyphomicrobiales bacterium]